MHARKPAQAKRVPGHRRHLLPLVLALLPVVSLCGSRTAGAETLVGLVGTVGPVGSYFVFDSAAPGMVMVVNISGLVGAERLVGIDVRPATGELFGLSNENRLYIVDPVS